MPAFNLDSVLLEDEQDAGNLRTSYKFAHKFYTNIDKKRNAARTLLPDGTKVWEIGIRSPGAYSINLLLKNLEIPEGGKLFIYNTEHSHIIGSYDFRNNSPSKIFPTQPIAGESIIIEYSEPPNVAFEGNFTVAEVNHDYRNFLRKEPDKDNNTPMLCMPDALCSPAAEENVRATVLLIINGNTMCSGTLMNNTNDDGTPYLLTAVHCFNDKLPISETQEHYIERSGTIIAFFNYNRSICNSKMKATEEMSLAAAYPRVILEKKDIALLELQDEPPAYFNAYYAGWNVEPDGKNAPYTNLHHPMAAVKKYGTYSSAISLGDYPKYGTQDLFDKQSHWTIPQWTVGSTDGGSSGSPLFDANNMVVGGLSGGSSYCNGVSSSTGKDNTDYFFALCKGWENENPENQLKTYLDPVGQNVTRYPGLDPNEQNPIVRLGNAKYNDGDLLITSAQASPNTGYVFGNSNLQTVEFAEKLEVFDETEIFGVYLMMPVMPYSYTSSVEVSIYSGDLYPETKLQTQNFVPQYLNYSSGGFYPRDKNTNLVATENFVLFDSIVNVKKHFFVSYKLNYSESAQFCVYNTQFSGSNRTNTAWVKDQTTGRWISADTYQYYGEKTSLAIQALIRNKNSDSIPVVQPDEFFAYFNKIDGTLYLNYLKNEPLLVEVYNLHGQIVEKKYINPDIRSVILSQKPAGTVGIVRIKTGQNTKSFKIIY
ncbi:hypothetical protein FACS1894160_2290 [Bacteroidia bacterium]|nr:hypothetical protein FACS1894160_2290 [Bacteroidia bacterium]